MRRSAFNWQQKGEDERAWVAQDGYLCLEVRQMENMANVEGPYLLVTARIEQRGWWDPTGAMGARIPGRFIPDGQKRAEEFARLLRKVG